MYQKTLLAVLAAAALSSVQAQTASDAPAAVQNAPAAESFGQKATSFLDSITDTVKNWVDKTPGEVDKYSQELKEKWPGIKDQFKEKWQQGLEKGGEAKDQVTKWMNDTFSKERMDKAETWINNFKAGTEEKVIDPLVPYLLSMRYPNPMDEWQAGYRKTVNVQVKGLETPLTVQLPISWDVSQDLNANGTTLMTWRSESGDGPYAVSLISTPEGATVDSIMAGLEKDKPGTTAKKLGNSQIKYLEYPVTSESKNAVTYYAVPLEDKTILLAAEITKKSDQTEVQLQEAMQKAQPFFALLAQSVFVKQQ